MKKLLLLLLVTSTLCAKAQSSTSKKSDPFNDTSFIRSVSILCTEHKAQKNIITRQDSIITALKGALTLIGLEYESCLMENKILDLDSDQKSRVISQAYTDNEILKQENEKLTGKLRVQRSLKWIFAAGGFVGGIVTTAILYIRNTQ